MQAVGIIVEYNPFHNGHKWHVEQARRLSGRQFVVGVMSGNFVQRGEPAIFDKWARAEMAIRSGVDLILEIPTVYAVRSAEYFATGSIRLLNSLGIVDHICFGAEHPDLSILSVLAKAIDSKQTVGALKDELGAGQTYAAALGRALAKHSAQPPEVIAAPNNILALEYIRAITKFAPDLIPLPIPRRMAGYHDTYITGSIASATAIRQALQSDSVDTGPATKALPPETTTIIEHMRQQGRGPITWAEFDQILLAKLRTTSLTKLAELPDVSEGLHNKIKPAALQATGFEELLTALKTKRYSRTRLQRIMVHTLLGTTRTELQRFDAAGPLYARVLAFNDRGRRLIRLIEGRAAIPVITKTTQFLSSRERDMHQLTPLQAMLSVDTLASDIYTLAMPNPAARRGGADFRTTPLYIPCSPSEV